MALKSLRNPCATRIKKWIFNKLPTNKHLCKIHQIDESICHSCRLVEEDNDHILRCSCENRHRIRRDWIEALYHYLDTTSATPKEVTRCIMRGVTNWLLGLPTPSIQSVSYLASSHLISAYESQTQIGWDQFLRGRISLEWSALVRFEYSKLHTIEKSNNKRPKYRSPDSWAKGLMS